MNTMTEPEVAAVLRELRAAYPKLRLWSEIIQDAGLHWMASGDPRPWLVMTGDMNRFRVELARIDAATAPDDEQGLSAYEDPGPCQWPGEETA